MKLSELIEQLENILADADGDPEVYKSFAGMMGIVDIATYVPETEAYCESVIIS